MTPTSKSFWSSSPRSERASGRSRSRRVSHFPVCHFPVSGNQTGKWQTGKWQTGKWQGKKYMSQIKSKPAFALRSSSRLSFCLIFVFWLLSCASAQNAQNESPEDELKHGKYQSALLSFTKQLQANPKDGKAQKGLLQAYLETGQYAEVETNAKKFLSTGGNDAQAGQASQARLMLGEVYAA